MELELHGAGIAANRTSTTDDTPDKSACGSKIRNGVKNARPKSRNWKFESISLQQRVCLSSEFAFPRRETAFFRGFVGRKQALRSAETDTVQRYGANGW